MQLDKTYGGMMQYKVTVTKLVPDSELDSDDFNDKSWVVGEHIFEANTEDDALDKFHETVPISSLEDFRIECELFSNAIRFIKE
jgi:hypothetical protein